MSTRYFGASVSLARVVQSALPTYASPAAVEADFSATVYRRVPTVTYASAVHVVLVEVDIETGKVALLRYVVAHDCGRVINPMIVDGQIQGGVAQGIGGDLYEEVLYDTSAWRQGRRRRRRHLAASGDCQRRGRRAPTV